MADTVLDDQRARAKADQVAERARQARYGAHQSELAQAGKPPTNYEAFCRLEAGQTPPSAPQPPSVATRPSTAMEGAAESPTAEESRPEAEPEPEEATKTKTPAKTHKKAP